MTEPLLRMRPEQQVDLRRERDRTHSHDPTEPGGPADVVAGMAGDHWRAPRDYGAQAHAAGRTGARDWGRGADGGPIRTPPPGRYRDDIAPPPLELHDGEQLVGGHPYSGVSRQLQAERRGPKNYQRSDERIREDICEALLGAYDLDSSEVTVEVGAGRVKLEGTVPERRMKHRIEDIAADARGVTEVENRIRVVRGSVGAGTSGL